MTLIKSISGIRGTVGGAQAENLTPPDVVKFTTAYARLIAERNPGKKLTIVVGRDARISGEMVSDLVEGTLLACGADVINVGLCTTPGYSKPSSSAIASTRLPSASVRNSPSELSSFRAFH